MSTRDIHDERPAREIYIDFVGIGWIRLPPFTWGRITLVPMLKAYVDLPPYMRGVHLSRSYKAVRSMTSEQVYREPEVLAERLLSLHEYSGRALVVLRASGLVREGDDYRSFEASKRVLYARGVGVTRRVWSYRFTTSNACPCALQTSLELTGRPLTHMQRVVVEVTLRGGHAEVDEEALISGLSSIVQPSLKGYLNRVEEVELIKGLVERPMFVEDVVREVASWLRDNLKWFKGYATVRALSFESIHEYNVEAALRVELG